MKQFDFTLGEQRFDGDAVAEESVQRALARAHASGVRPVCACQPAGGVAMYIAKYASGYRIKRLPDSGMRHHPECEHFEPDVEYSGLRELVGEAVLQKDDGLVEIKVDFPISKVSGRAPPAGTEPSQPAEVKAKRRTMTLRAVLHYLLEHAQFNRWVPAMLGKRNQNVFSHYLLETARSVMVKGLPLESILYVPEGFRVERKDELADRRRNKLAFLRGRAAGESRLAIAIGELKSADPTPYGFRLTLKHMPDAPLYMSEKDWQRFAKRFSAELQAANADVAEAARPLAIASFAERRPGVYQVEAISMTLLSPQWIPLNCIDELELINQLVAERRTFVKPLAYDSGPAACLPAALLLDAGDEPLPLFLIPMLEDSKASAKVRDSVAALSDYAWVWDCASEDMPALPAPGSGSRRDAA